MTGAARRGVLAALTVGLVAGLAPGWASPALAGGDDDAPATTEPDASSDPIFELAGLDRSWLAPGEAANALIRVTDPRAVEINVVAHQALDSRSEFEETLEGEGLGSVVGQVSFPLTTLAPSVPGTVVLPIGLQNPAAARDPVRLPLSRTGVYPIELELRDGDGNARAAFVLPLVVVAPGPGGTPVLGEKLRVAWIWPLVTDPAVLPDGQPDPEVLAELRNDGRLGRQAGALAAAPDIPLTLAPGPETIESWTALARDDQTLAPSLASMQAALTTNQVLSGPYVPINVPSLIKGGFDSEVGAELARGNETLSSLLGTRLDPRTALPGPMDLAALVELRDANVDRMIVDSDTLVPIDSQFTPAQPVTLQAAGREATTVVSDSGLVATLTSDAPPALRAQQFLAALTVVALEQPNVVRGVAVANPPDWEAPDGLLDAALAGLRGHPLLAPVDVDQLLAQVPPATDLEGRTVVRDLEPYVPPSPPVTPAAFLDAAGRLGGLRSLIGAGDLRIVEGDRALRVALSSAWDGSAGRLRAQAELGVIDQSIDAVLAQIRVPVGSTVTLTARKGEIPVTFLNETDQTIRVKVKLESNKLFFPDGAEREVELPPRNTTVGFTVESRASGTFPLVLTVTSVDEELVIQSTRVRVRSTFVSGVGVFITVGAAVFLAVWWLLHFRRRRRPAAEPSA
ncbi:MAG TPA: DUF6049 family protein [Acidimicrobiia bacterium]|nr:DUF6049 family protein [Acidimicrobiia bacterium]